MTKHLTLILVSLACLTAQVLPHSIPQREVVTVEVPARRPLMWETCALPAEEYNRICRHRRKSL